MDIFISCLNWVNAVPGILQGISMYLGRKGPLNKDTVFAMTTDEESHLKNAASHCSTTSRSAGLLPVEIILTGGLWQTLSGHQVHHRRLPCGQSQCWQCHVPVKKSTLVYQPEDLRFRDLKDECCLCWSSQSDLTDSSSHSGGQLSKTNWAMSPALSLGLNKYSLVLPLTRIKRKFI